MTGRATELRNGVRVERLALGGSRWALAADLHLSQDLDASYGGVFPAANLERATEQWATAEPDVLLVNGDLAWDTGEREDYARLAERLSAVRVPTIWAPGNHDHRGRLLEQLAPSREPAPEKLVTVAEGPDVRLIALDSLYRTDVVPGLLGKEQRALLPELLEEQPEQPTVLTVHHPLRDGDQHLLDGDRLLALLEPHPQVKAVFTAHDHVFRFEQRGRLHVVAMPAVGFPFEAGERTGWLETSADREGLAIRLRSAEEAGAWTRIGWAPEAA